jgi:hypothetical protein
LGVGIEEASAIIQKALEIYRDYEIPQEVPKDLPLVEEFRETKPLGKQLTDVEAIFIQHHLGPLVPRIRAMISDGLDPESCWFIDIPYSTNEKVREEIDKMHCPDEQPERLSDDLLKPFDDPLEPYSKAQLQRVQNVVLQVTRKRIGEREQRRLLIVDDGAYFVRAIRDLTEEDRERVQKVLRNRVHIVEQTTRGYRYLKEGANMEIAYALGAPIVSVARSYTKSYLESPFIGASVARGVIRALKEEKHSRRGSTLVIGFGKVGEATTEALGKYEDPKGLNVFDTDLEKKEAIERTGAKFCASFPQSGSYDLVVGCTGYGSFPLDRRFLLADGALLTSGSSAAIELNREGFVELAKEHDEIEILNKEATKEKGIHATIEILDGENSFSFFNAGFPVNFDGLMECLPTELIQPTHGLLFAACRQTLQSKGPSFSFLNLSDDFWFYEHGLEHIKRDFC